MSKKNIRSPQHLPPTRFRTAAAPLHEYMSFSFKYLNLAHPKFSVQQKDTAYFLALQQRLKDLSGLTPSELRQPRNPKTLRVHSIDWDAVSEPNFGMKEEEQIVGENAYQFALSANDYGRVHGFIIGSTFYIVWLDPDHKLYSKKTIKPKPFAGLPLPLLLPTSYFLFPISYFLLPTPLHHRYLFLR